MSDYGIMLFIFVIGCMAGVGLGFVIAAMMSASAQRDRRELASHVRSNYEDSVLWTRPVENGPLGKGGA